MAADRKLTEQMVVHDLKYKVIKYAYSRSQTPTTCSVLSDRSQTPIISSASNHSISEVATTVASPVPLIEVTTTVCSENSSSDEAEGERNRFQQNTLGNTEQRNPQPMFHQQLHSNPLLGIAQIVPRSQFLKILSFGQMFSFLTEKVRTGGF